MKMFTERFIHEDLYPLCPLKMLYVKNAAIIRGREYTGDYSTVTLINIQPLTAH
jgi:hypothetical protein